MTVTNPKCHKCDKSAFPMERIAVDAVIFHKTCFRCGECNKVLSLGSYAALKGVYYCKVTNRTLRATRP